MTACLPVAFWGTWNNAQTMPLLVEEFLPSDEDSQRELLISWVEQETIYMNDLAEILSRVKDKKSADAAAPAVQEIRSKSEDERRQLFQRIEDLSNGDHIPRSLQESFFLALKKSLDEEKRLMDELQDGSPCYGSQLLLNALIGPLIGNTEK